MSGGTYTLVLERDGAGAIEVGALGQRRFPAGWYAYTGSALGSGGFARIDRHRAVAAGENDTRHWHVDYLLYDADTTVDRTFTTEADVECAIARRLVEAVEGLDAVAAFGCSDCDCRSHLAYARRRDELLSAAECAHAGVTERDRHA